MSVFLFIGRAAGRKTGSPLFLAVAPCNQMGMLMMDW
jgi:hypothetical protein